jgi:peptidoglycan/xylan/chitin deacetylase (PgdA/CDA1 family)
MSKTYHHITAFSMLTAFAVLLLAAAQSAAQSVAVDIPASELATQPSPLVRAAPIVGDLHILSYHDVAVDDAALQRLRDGQAVTQATLVRHFAWLRDNGYAVVSMAQVLNARAGGAALPPRAVLLTFDDAYKSFHSHVLPLLELFDFSATLAVVGLWIEVSDGDSIPFGDEKLSRGRFMTWAELRDVAASGRVEIASHSFDLHRGHISNPQRNVAPSATALRYDINSGTYETQAALFARVTQDLQRNNALLQQRLGKPPRVMVWPYGEHTPGTQRIAVEQGLVVGLTLGNGVNQVSTPLTALNRVLIQSGTDVTDLERALRPQRERTVRALEVDLDAVFDADNAQQEKKLSALLDWLQRLAPSSIFLKSISAARDPTGRPFVYFPSPLLPLRADLFNRVAWQVRARLGISVFAWLPTATLPVAMTSAFDAGGTAASRLALPTLFGDMVRSVALAGVYFSEMDATQDALVDALTQAANNERAQLRVARRMAPPSAAELDVAADRARWLKRVAGLTWIVMTPAPSSVTESASSNNAWGLHPSPVAARLSAQQQLARYAERGVPLDRVVWRAQDSSASTVAALAALNGAGARHFSYGAPEPFDASANDGLRRLLSTEGTPIAR